MTARTGSRTSIELAQSESGIPRSCVVFTPRPLADAMVRALGDQDHAAWLEPCVGAGVFLEALAAADVPPFRVRGLDVETTETVQDRLARTIRGVDFLSWSLDTAERFSRVVANPPYAALNRMPEQVQNSALRILVPGTSRPVALGANAWFAFLCASIGLLRRRGSIAFLLPAAWEYADYAAPLRGSIGRLFDAVEIHRCRQPLFNTVAEGTVVLLARGYQGVRSGEPRPSPRRVLYKTPEKLIAALAAGHLKSVQSRVVDIGRSPLPSTGHAVARQIAKSGTKKTCLGEVMRLRLGGVTGDAKFFVLSEEQRRRYNLPCSVCRPIISRARHMVGGAIRSRDWYQLRDDGERVWLFDPKPSQVDLEPVKRYLTLGSEDGGCDRKALKVRSREPWCRTPIQRHIDGFMSGMSGWGPWVVFKQMPRLAATNTLYVVHFQSAKTDDERAAWAMWLLTSEAVRHLRRIGRRYADGLVKFEPGDIAELPIGTPLEAEGARAAYERAVRLLLKGNKAASRREADKWF